MTKQGGRHVRGDLKFMRPSFVFFLCLCLVVVKAEYAQLLGDSLLFYEAQRSGRMPTNNRVTWRNDSALTDGSDVNLDLAGGYYDAGDYIKFTFPLCYTLTTLSWGGIEYFQGYKKAAQLEYLRSMLKWGTDWLIKAHPSPDVLYVQVGNSEIDNRYWGPDTNIPLPRPSYQINGSAFGTDVAAEAASAFASTSILFRMLAQESGNRDDDAYAQLLLNHAQQLYNASTHIRPFRQYQDVVHLGGDFYSSSDYRDDLTLAALWMYRATRDQIYLNDATAFYRDFGIANHIAPNNWDDKFGSVYVLFAQLTMHGDPTFESRKQEAETYLDKLIAANRTKGGLMWWKDASANNSLSVALGVSDLLMIYASSVLLPLSRDHGNGDNSFLSKAVKYKGEAPNSPKHPHHAGASGVIGLQQMGYSALPAHVLYGGGPDENDKFTDRLDNWAQSEVALDYNAPYQNVLAHQVMYIVSDPVDVPSREAPQISQWLPGWIIAISVILPITAIAIIVGIIWLRRRNRLSSKNNKRSSADSTIPILTVQTPPRAHVHEKNMTTV
ncbi:hypothetical protein DFQ29_009705 [Apophysomyces sp. BC1021]|nr:hypothetical protein DFQ29_009705 [Apophysomyces sp. BC1021]